MEFSKIEKTVILAFYYIGKAKYIEKFKARFNQYFKRDISSQTILFEVAKVKNIDPANNVQSQQGNVYFELWNYYISEGRVDALKQFYNSFKQGDYIFREVKLPDEDELVPFSKKVCVAPKDVPTAPPENYQQGLNTYKRHREVVLNALALAEYKCEADCETPLFCRKDGVTNYTEAHHIIPLCYQKDFEYSLDIEANVVSLCPRCHRLMHYGRDYENLLKRLYDKRTERLKKCGINITYEQLLLLYR